MRYRSGSGRKEGKTGGNENAGLPCAQGRPPGLFTLRFVNGGLQRFR